MVFNRFFWTTVSKTVRPMLSDRCAVLSSPVVSVCPVCDIGVLWPNGRMDQDETWHAGRPWPGHIVLYGEFWGDSYPSPNRHNPPIFGPYLLRPNGWRDQVPLGREVGLGPSDIVLDGDPAPHSQKWGRAPNFRPMSIVAIQLDGSRWHLAWRWASVQTILC